MRDSSTMRLGVEILLIASAFVITAGPSTGETVADTTFTCHLMALHIVLSYSFINCSLGSHATACGRERGAPATREEMMRVRPRSLGPPPTAKQSIPLKLYEKEQGNLLGKTILVFPAM
jgi:hypothetical protein